MTTSAGDLNKRINIFRKTIVDTGLSEKETFVSTGSTWANVKFVSDGEKFRGGSVASDISIRFIIRKRAITTEHRISYDNITYSIYGIKPLDNNFMEITGGNVK